MNHRLRLLVLASGAMAIAASGPARAAQPADVTVSYQAPASLVLHEPVLVELTIENRSAEPVQVDLGFNRRERFAITIKGPRGVIPEKVLTETGLGRRGLISVAANGRYQQQLLLNDWFPFEDAGQYAIEIQLRSRLTTASGGAIDTPTTGRLDLEITPRNDAVLRATCERLAQIAAGAREAQQRMDAAKALSEVADPVVVPYLRALLQKPGAEDMMIVMRGLTRVGTAEARAALEEAAQSANGEQAALARDALRRMPAK
jgi:hypothetical protein